MDTLKAANVTAVLLALLCYLAAFGSAGGADAIAFFFGFTLWPFVINAFLLFRWHTAAAQWLLLATSRAYAAWFAFVFVDVTYLHPDPQGPIAFLYVGAFAAPVLSVLWFVARAIEHRQRAA